MEKTSDKDEAESKTETSGLIAKPVASEEKPSDDGAAQAESSSREPTKPREQEESNVAVTEVAVAASAAPSSSSSSPPDAVKMTKSAMKKKRRLERIMANRQAKRDRKKQQRLEKAIAAGRDLEQERREMQARTQAGDSWRKRQAHWEEKIAKSGSSSSFQVAIDCGFEESMTYKEINSLSQQLRYCYATNKRSPRPCLLAATSIGGTTLKLLQKVSGYESWGNRAFTCTEKALDQYYESRLADVVYLTSDAETVLDKLDDDKIYVIGGIVDRNRLQKAALNRAQSLGVATAKLPLDGLLQMEATPVLTCNHVFEIPMHFKEHSNWQQALMSVLPQRKGARPANQKKAKSSTTSSASSSEKKQDDKSTDSSSQTEGTNKSTKDDDGKNSASHATEEAKLPQESENSHGLGADTKCDS